MSWVRFDDQYPIHRKVAGLSDTAFRLHSAAIFWCARNGTDGFLPEEDLDQVCAQVRAPARFASECVRRGTWHPAAHTCTSEDCPEPRDEPGWVIHDYLHYQPTKDETEVAKKKQQEQKSAGGKLGNHRRWHAGPDGKPNPDCPWCLAGPSSVSDRYPIGESDRSAITPSRPGLSVVDVDNQSPRRNARSDAVIEQIIRSIYETTSRVIDRDWAEKIAGHILDRQKPSRPAAYVKAVIENEPDPFTRFLPSGGIA